MKPRTTLILVLAALLLGGLVVLDYYKGTPTEEAKTRRKRILDFQARDITRIELAQTNQTIVLEKSDDRWQLKQPLQARASHTAVSSMLDELEFAERTRTLSGNDLDATSLKDFGLDFPRLTVTLHGRKAPMTLHVGHETPTKDELYAQVKGRQEVLIAPKSLYQRLNKTLDDLRDRTVLEFSAAATTRLEIRSDKRVTELAKTAPAPGGETRWMLTRPLSARADPRKVSELLTELNALRVLDFVSEDPKDVLTYQLAEPQKEITVWTGESGKTLLLGGAPTHDATKVYAKLKTADSIFTVAATSVQKFAVQPNDLRDARILAFSETDVAAIELLHGAHKLLLERAEPGWKIAAPVQTAAEESIVSQTLAQLAALEAKQFTADVATDLDKYGLAAPAVTLTLRRDATHIVAQLLVGSLDPTQALRYVKRADEPFIYAVDAKIADWLPAGHLSWRARRLTDLTPEQISRLVLERPSARTVLERGGDGAWRLLEPAQGVLDTDSLQRLLDAFTQLRAQEFLREGRDNLAEYGLDAPEARLTVVAGEKTHTVALGKLRDADQRFAFWDEPPLVFTVWTAQADVLAKDLVTVPAPSLPAPSGGETTSPPTQAPAQMPASQP